MHCSPCSGPSYALQSLQRPFLCTAVLAAARPAPVHAVARTAVPAAALPAPVHAVARTAVLALALGAPVQAVARTAVPALALGAPVAAVARTAVLALVLGVPVVALQWGIFLRDWLHKRFHEELMLHRITRNFLRFVELPAGRHMRCHIYPPRISPGAAPHTRGPHA
jgi:hypothetical protein